MLLSRRRHTGVNQLDFRIIAVFYQPVGRDKNEVDMVASRVINSNLNCSRFS